MFCCRGLPVDEDEDNDENAKNIAKNECDHEDEDLNICNNTMIDHEYEEEDDEI